MVVVTDTAKPRIAVTKDGPYIVTGNVPLVRLAAPPTTGETGEWHIEETLPPRQSYALCRCGRSRMVPFCDYKHLRVKFDGTETASRAEDAADADDRPDGAVSIGFVPKEYEGSPCDPLWVRGPIDVVSADGLTYASGGAALCRCGASRTKPFCDGSHSA